MRHSVSQNEMKLKHVLKTFSLSPSFAPSLQIKSLEKTKVEHIKK